MTTSLGKIGFAGIGAMGTAPTQSWGVALATGAGAYADAKTGQSLRSISGRLQEGLNEDQAMSITGRPDSVVLQNCGMKTASPWQCKIYHFDTGLDVLFERRPDGVWAVNSWLPQ